MNLTTITNIPRSNWKRVATYSVSGIAGVALAVSPNAGLSGTLKSSDFDQTVSPLARTEALRQVSDADIAASVLSTELANFSNVDPARQGTLAPAFSAEYAQYISLQEQVLVALNRAAFPLERASEEYAQYISLQEQVLVALSGTAAD